MEIIKNKSYNSGIHIAQHNRITSSNVPKLTSYIRMLQVLFILFGLYGSIFSFITGLNIEVEKRPIFITMFLSTIYFYYILQLNKIIKYTIPITTAVYLMAVFEFYKEIQNGFWHIENIYIEHLNDYFGLAIYPYIVGDYNPKSVITIFLIFVTIILSFMLTSVILSNNIRGIYFFITLPIYALPIVVGIIPTPLPSILYFVCCICIIGMGTAMRKYNSKYSHKNKKDVKKRIKRNIGLEKRFRYIIGFKIGVILGLILSILIGIAACILPKKSYEEKYNFADMKQKIQDEMMNLSFDKVTKTIEKTDFSQIQIFKEQTKFDFGGLNGGDLGDHGEVTFDNKKVLEVRLPVSNDTIYLKGFVGSNYYGDKWDELTYSEKEEYLDIAKIWNGSDFLIGNQSAYFLSIIGKLDDNIYPSLRFHESEMTVRNVRTNKRYAYAPYITNFKEQNSMNLTNEEYVLPIKRRDEYTFSYYNLYNNLFLYDGDKEYEEAAQFYSDHFVDDLVTNEALKDLEDYRKYELSYRDFVYDTYTRLPAKGLDRLKQDINLMKYKTDASYSLSDKISYVRYYLWNNTSYSLKPGKLPSNKDYIEYFLYENKLGYCAHYASAATMMLRAMGIPARYAEGYVIKTSNMDKGNTVEEGKYTIRGEDDAYNILIKNVEVLDSNAHAWVEVYIDGYGWVPVECTPGYSFSEDNEVLANIDSPALPTATPSQPTITPSVEKDEVEEVSNSVEEKEEAKTTSKPTKQPERENNINSATSDKPSDKVIINREYHKKAGTLVVRIVCILLLIIVVLLNRWLLQKVTYTYKFKKSNSNNKVILYYKDILRVLSYMGIPFDESISYEEAAKKIEEECKFFKNNEFTNILNITLKAKFGYGRPKDMEVEMMESMYHNIMDELYKNKSVFKKWYLKYIKLFG